jgi:hypothetical protein
MAAEEMGDAEQSCFLLGISVSGIVSTILISPRRLEQM